MAFRSTDSKNTTNTERRKHWRDRRTPVERRNSSRLLHSGIDCRSGSPRRAADIAGKLADGDVWWQPVQTKQAE